MQIETMMVGQKIYIRSIQEADVYGRWWQWFNDPEVTRHMNKGQEFNSIEKQLAFFNKMRISEGDCVLAICELETKKHIGTTAFHNIRVEFDKRVGSFGIVIGEKEYWGKGIGTEVWRMMVNYGFKELRLDQIETKIFSTNNASLKVSKKLGFQLVKRMKSELVKHGRSIDRILFRLEKDAWGPQP